jgi:ribosomal-protein-serine acetyltransferase
MRPPLPFETERLVLRAPSPDHAPAVQEAIEESFEALHPWMPWAVKLQTFEETQDFLARSERQFKADENYVVLGFLRESGRFVLGSGLHPRSRDVPSYEIGYWCRTSLQGNGYVLEAVNALANLGLGLMGARRLEIRCDASNVASARVAARAGFEHEATLRRERVANDGTLSDTLIFAKLA